MDRGVYLEAVIMFPAGIVPSEKGGVDLDRVRVGKL